MLYFSQLIPMEVRGRKIIPMTPNAIVFCHYAVAAALEKFTAVSKELR